MFYDENILTVSQLNGFIKDVLTMGFPQKVWVCGEIQGYDRNRNKPHVFFDLCEKEPQSHAVVARIGLVIFSGRKAAVDEMLAQAQNAFSLKDDIEVKFLCQVDFYPPHGAVRLIVESIDPTYTLGKIAQEKQRLIALLKKAGTLDANKARPFPLVPLRIGLITAFDSAAYNDFVSELSGSGYGFKVFCRNTLMQGAKAEKDVVAALKMFQETEGIDVIVITRGGGAIAELSCFDSRPIAEAIAATPVPVVSGIGHEINVTVTDLAAYAYHKTPTAVARFLVECVGGFIAGLQEQTRDLQDKAQAMITGQHVRLRHAAQDLQQVAFFSLKYQEQELKRIEKSLPVFPLKLVKDAARAMASRQAALTSALKVFRKTAEARLQHYRSVIDLADPANIIRKGFSLTRLPDGRLVRSLSQVRPGDTVRTELSDGCFDSRVNNILKEDQREGDKIQ
ncbi:MAG TPA: exodeoxyribonuclease VII large subunit [Candidatus Omnitrophota bacterium]|nr:exodeoxyribonuclease VII large subunit [Candidatus Omnitrophota bacterium]